METHQQPQHHELRGLEALQYAMQTGAPLMRRHTFGVRKERVSSRVGYSLWGLGLESQLYVEVES
jgi:hypothetical protein